MSRLRQLLASLPSCAQLALSLALAFILAACGATVQVSPQRKDLAIRTIALLPSDVPADTRAERVERVRTLVRAELENSGFVLLDDRVVNATCKERTCPERADLFKSAPLDALARLTVKSAATNNFGIGYVDLLEGKLELIDSGAKILETVEYTESKRGGLLFNSGQVVAAFKTQANSFQDSTFEPLARAFARHITHSLTPPQAVDDEALRRAVKITAANFTRGIDGLVTLCLTGPPGNLASASIGPASLELIERGAGAERQYCATQPEALFGGSEDIRVELRSPLGGYDTKIVAAPVPRSVCALDRVLSLARAGSGYAISVGCGGSACNLTDVESCRNERKAIFRAPSARGPFVKIATFIGTEWRDASPPPRGAVYSVQIDRPGISRGNPVLLQENTAETSAKSATS